MKVTIYGIKKTAHFSDAFIKVKLPKLKFPVEVEVNFTGTFRAPIEWREYTDGYFTAAKYLTINSDFKCIKYLL